MVHSFKEFLYSILQEKDSDVVCTPVSGFDAGGRNVTALPNSFDFGDILKFGTLGAGVGCATGPNSGDFAHIVGWNVKAGPCIGGALGAAVLRLIWKN
jgi:hypothetical protein